MSVVIIGGGVTGLCLAYLLARDGVPVTLVEAGASPGGLLSGFEPVPGGARLEHYYHHFFTHDVEINWLFRELGIERETFFRPTSMGIFRDGVIYPFNGAADLLRFKPIGLGDRVRFGASSLLMSYWGALANRERTAALDWFDRWAGRRATRAIWRPLMTSKFGEAAGDIPLAWMAGRIRQRARSRKGTAEQLGYLHGSMGRLVDVLTERLAAMGVRTMLGAPVRSLILAEGRAVGVRTDAGEVRGDRIVATIPTDILAKVVAAANPSYADELARVRYIGAIVTVLVMRRQLSPVYWLNVADDGYDFGGVIEQTNFVPPSEYGGKHIAYLSKYADWSNPLWQLTDDQLVDRQLDQCGRLFKTDVRANVERSFVFRARYAATLTDLGFNERVPAMRSPIDGLFVASMPHVYPDERSVNNSIRVAAAAKQAMGLDAGLMPPPGNSLAAKYGHGRAS